MFADSSALKWYQSFEKIIYRVTFCTKFLLKKQRQFDLRIFANIFFEKWYFAIFFYLIWVKIWHWNSFRNIYKNCFIFRNIELSGRPRSDSGERFFSHFFDHVIKIISAYISSSAPFCVFKGTLQNFLNSKSDIFGQLGNCLKSVRRYSGVYKDGPEIWVARPVFFCRPSFFFLQKIVARPIFRINIYSAYFVKIKKNAARPKNHQKSPIMARPVRGKNVFWPVLIYASYRTKLSVF